jgi:hypothetical protein
MANVYGGVETVLTKIQIPKRLSIGHIIVGIKMAVAHPYAF